MSETPEQRQQRIQKMMDESELTYRKLHGIQDYEDFQIGEYQEDQVRKMMEANILFIINYIFHTFQIILSLLLLSQQKQLQKLVIIHRHGVRTTGNPNQNAHEDTSSVFNCDLSQKLKYEQQNSSGQIVYDVNNPMIGNCTENQLLGVGRQQLQNLAQYLQLKYNNNYNFSLKQLINQNKSYFRSTYTPRTIDSINGLISFLTNLSKVDVHTGSPNMEPLRLSNCEFADKYYDYAPNVPQIRQYDQQMRTLANKLGYSDDDYFEWWMAQDEFLPRRLMQMDLPPNVTTDEENLSYQLTDTEWGLEYCQQDQTLLNQWLEVSIGAFLPELIHYLKSDYKLIIISAHEESIAPLMRIISDNFDCKEPEFASAVEIRIFDDDTIELDYKGKQMIMSACTKDVCEVQDFITQLNQWAISWDKRIELCNYWPY